MLVEGVCEVVDGRTFVLSLDEIKVVVVGVEESRWRCLMGAGVEKHHWTHVGGG